MVSVLENTVGTNASKDTQFAKIAKKSKERKSVPVVNLSLKEDIAK